jgi:dienelactone hydrolase
MGRSMGGGGTLEAAADRPSLAAAIPLTGWDTRKSFSTNRVPTLVVGAEADTVAPVSSHSIPFYTSLSATYEKA